MLRSDLIQIVLSTLCLLALIAPSPARAEFGLPLEDITGCVTTPRGEPIAGAEVLVLGTVRRTRTDSGGCFRIAQIPVADVQLVVSSPGHASAFLRVDIGRDLDSGGLEIVLDDLERDRDAQWKRLLSAMDRPGLGRQLGLPEASRAGDIGSEERLHSRLSAQFNGRAEAAIREESVLRGGIQLGGSTGPLHLAGMAEGLEAVSRPSNLQLSRPGPFDLYPVFLRDLYRLGAEGSAWLDAGDTVDLVGGFRASRLEGDAYSMIWSRPGWVETFYDTTQTGLVVKRHGRFSDEKIDESYEYFDATGHLPTERRDRWDAHLSLQHRVGPETRYTAGIEFRREALESRVGDKSAWQYEGDRYSDFWFNYTDREIYPFYAIAGDFPRLVEAEAGDYRAMLDLQTEVSDWTLLAGGRTGYRDSRYFEVLQPYLTNAEGEIGAERVEYHQYDLSVSLCAGSRWQKDEVEIEGGITYDAFELLDQLPIESFADELESEWTPHLRFAYDIVPSTRIDFQWNRSFRKPDAGDLLEMGGRTFTGFPVVGAADLEAETTASWRTALTRKFGDWTQVQLAGFSSTTDNDYRVELRSVFGQVGRVPTLANGFESIHRGLELEISRRFDGRSGATARYTLSDWKGDAVGIFDPTGDFSFLALNEDVPHPEDSRHRLEASLDFSLDPRFWISTEFRFESGRPFTPYRSGSSGRANYGEIRSARLPSLSTLVLKAEYRVPAWKQRFSIHAIVDNALDTRNLVHLSPVNWPVPPEAQLNDYLQYYSETGRTGGAYRLYDREADEYNWIRLHDPRMVGPSRSLVLGLTARL